MIKIDIPGFRNVRLKHLVMDYNGTLAQDGILLQGVKERLIQLSKKLQLHVITADTFGNVKNEIAALPCKLALLKKENQAKEKMEYVKKLGAGETVSVGNGRNDRLMLKEAVIGIVIIQGEGASGESVMAADVVAPDIITGLDLLLNPLRLKATLRS